MPHSQKADLLHRRRERNASKKAATAVPSSGETIRFQRPVENSRDYFSSTPLGYTQTGVVLVGAVDSSIPASSSLNDNRENLFITQSEYVTSASYPTPASLPWQLARGRNLQHVPSRLSRLENIPTQSAILPPTPNCEHCGAKRFPSEPPSFCCSEGEISVVAPAMPYALKRLFIGNDEECEHFRKNSRTYNNNVTFTSYGAKYDHELTKNTKGVYTFRVQGQVYHFLDGLISRSDKSSGVQLYFFDTDEEQTNRVQNSDKLRPATLKLLMTILQENPYRRFFKELRHVQAIETHTIVLRCYSGLDQRVFNLPTASQVAAIWTEPDDELAEKSPHIQVYSHSNASYRVQSYYACYDPVQYPLLFPRGESGWHRRIKRLFSKMKKPDTDDPEVHVDFSSAQDPSALFHFEDIAVRQKTSQDYTVSAREYYCYRLQIRDNDDSILIHSLRLFQQFVVGTYIKIETSRLDFHRKRQTEIRTEILQGVLDSVAIGQTQGSRVGRRIVLPASFIGDPRDMRRRYLDAMTLVQKYGKSDIFLTMTCNPMWKEIQENLQYHEKPQDRPDLLARVFRAKFEMLKVELLKKQIFGEVAACVYVIEFQKRGFPHAHLLLILKSGSKLLNPESYDKIVCAEIPDPVKNRHLYSLVIKHMIHGPCGYRDKQSPCMRAGKCKNHYPKNFAPYTVHGEDSYACYRRRDDGRKIKVRKHELNNLWVIPYSPYLLALFDCHINVEICSTVKLVKYLYKYIFKGHDLISFNLVDQGSSGTIDEINSFQQARWVSPPEALWRIYEFRLTEMNPAVYTLQVHLPDQQFVSFDKSSDLWYLLRKIDFSKTMLTQFFRMNKTNATAQNLKCLYRDFPQHFVWTPKTKTWSERSRRTVIGRLVTVEPREGERYYLRLLLTHIPGPTSFDDLLMVRGHKTASFREACLELDLLESDSYIEQALEETAQFQMPYLLSSAHRHCTPIEIKRKVLWDINVTLEHMGKTLDDYHFLEDSFASCHVSSSKGQAFFVDGPGGTGKTFLYRALLASLRSQGYVAIAVATSGVAASLLPGGRTAHSRFKIPLDFSKQKACQLSKQSSVAKLIVDAKLILWDEASMAKREAIEAFHCLLTDIMESDLPFGGKTIAFGGDFRQTLPIVEHLPPPDLVQSTLLCSHLWSHMCKLQLRTNMRAALDPTFSAFLLRVGEGVEHVDEHSQISLPSHMVIPYHNKQESLDRLLGIIFPDLNLYSCDRYQMINRCVLCPKNYSVDEINEVMIAKFPGCLHRYISCDRTVDRRYQADYQDFLNSLNPKGLPPHQLLLKENCPIMLLRNLNPTEGLCNGTRLICRELAEHTISAEIVSGLHRGKKVFIPKIPLQTSHTEKNGIPFIRTQFPVRLCFAMTINKSQGQTLDYVGIYLREPVFSHGQLYVALSRARNSSAVKVLIASGTSDDVKTDCKTRNVGSQVEGIIFNHDIPKISHRLQIYKKYLISNAIVRLIPEKYQTSDLKIQWVLTSRTVIEPAMMMMTFSL
nr:uncharacterized protein LOC113708416 [Coffea arabica]